MMKKLNSIILSAFFAIFLFLYFGSCETKKEDPKPTTQVGDTLWIHTKPALENTTYISNMALAIGKDGTVYYEADGGTLNWESSRIYAINKNDGSLKWKTEPLAIWHPNSNILVDDNGVIYMLSYTKLYSINPETGAFNWEWEVPTTILHDGNEVYSYGEVGGLALADNGDLIFKTNGSGVYYRAMYCVSPQGNTRWYRVIGATINNITIGYYGTIYDYQSDMGVKYLYAIYPEDGSVRWRKKLNYHEAAANNIVVNQNGHLICSSSDSLALVNVDIGEYVGKVALSVSEKQKIVDINGFIYVYDVWSGLHVIDSQNGVEKEILNIGYNCITDEKGRLYRVSLDKFNCYTNTGELSWSFTTGGANPAAIALSNDNILYVASSEKVFAIQGDAPLPQNVWACPTHDNRNTFNFSKH
jgi:outer membrane protein assembly factor BamB